MNAYLRLDSLCSKISSRWAVSLRKFITIAIYVENRGNYHFFKVKTAILDCVFLEYSRIPVFSDIKSHKNLQSPVDKMANSVFFEISIDSHPVGRIIFDLFPDTPITSSNFRSLCLGTSGFAPSGQKLTYQGSAFHRIIPEFMIQGGDFTRGNGTGGCSIYGAKFKDENFLHQHSRAFLLSMANAGRDTNGSQFFITTVECPWLDGKHVVFGEVTEGQEVLRLIEAQGSSSGKPKTRVVIENCGEV